MPSTMQAGPRVQQGMAPAPSALRPQCAR
jgi:hypothetical protein